MNVRVPVVAVMLYQDRVDGRCVWLAKRTSGREDLRGLVECPAGKCEPGEAASTAAMRELLEETGLSISRERLVPRGTLIFRHAGDDHDTEVSLFETEIYPHEEPRNTEPDKRDHWAARRLTGDLPGYGEMTPASATLVRGLRFVLGLRG